MKKLLLLIPALLLAGCGGEAASSTLSPSSVPASDPSSSASSSPSSSDAPISDLDAYEEGSEEAKKALASLRKVGHKAYIDNDVSVYRYDGAVSTHIHALSDIAHSYGEDRGYREQITTEYYDVTFEQNSEGEWEVIEEDNTSSRSTIPAYYFEGSGGEAVRETLNADNTVSRTIQGDYSDTSLVYTTYAFEELFKNPWDYIRSADITKGDDGKLHLDTEKANFLVDCYTQNTLNAINFVEDCVINVDENGAITSLDITTPDQYVEGLYRRVSKLGVTYRDAGTTELEHMAPKTTENPGLATALKALVGKTNFSYDRAIGITDASGEVSGRHNYAYFTEDMVYFHQLYSAYPDPTAEQNQKLYTEGDDYDYKVQKEDDGIYHVYGYKYGGTGWAWAAESLNGTTPYTIAKFEDIGPRYDQVSAAVFESKGNHVYEACEEVLPYIGAYFDNGFEGVHSSVLDGGTTKCVVTLNEDETMIDKVELSFSMLTEGYNLVISLKDVGTTVIPSFVS